MSATTTSDQFVPPPGTEGRGAGEQTAPLPRPFRWLLPTFGHLSLVVAAVLVVGSWCFVLFLDRQAQHPFFSGETWSRATAFLADLAGIGVDRTPAYLQPDRWAHAARLAYETLAMSVLAAGIAASGALATFMFGAYNVMLGELAPERGRLRPLGFLAIRGLWALSRSIPELVWAMLVVFVLAPGMLPGAVALGLHNFGVVGKLASEVVESLDPRPFQALRTAGASRLQMLLYGVLPQALPQFLTYLFYRWEVIIRTTLVVGVVAAGGLGADFRLAMSHFHYTTITLLLLCYLAIVLAVDLIAGGLRRLTQ